MKSPYKVTISGPDKRINSAIAREIFNTLNETHFECWGILENKEDTTWSERAAGDHEGIMVELDLYEDTTEVDIVTELVTAKVVDATSAKLASDWDFHTVSED